MINQQTPADTVTDVAPTAATNGQSSAPDTRRQPDTDRTYDAIVVGGGPGGAVTAIVMARAGLRVCLLEKDSHPRFHIGESFLPRCTPLIDELGLREQFDKLPHVPKFGGEFGFGNDPNTMKFGFSDGLLPGFPVFNIERALLDKMLFDAAASAGAEIYENTTVRRIVRLNEGDVAVEVDGQMVAGRILMDASGQGTLVARHLGRRRPFANPQLQKVAYFAHFDNVTRLTGEHAGHPSILMADEGWFWIIAINDTTTSIGFVTRPDFAKKVHVPADQFLQWAVARCPVVRERMKHSTGPATNRVLADFSYTCGPGAGPGFYLIGDAGSFLDPIFSTGATLAMIGGQKAATLAIEQLGGRINPRSAQKSYSRFISGSTGVFWRLIQNFYKHTFREMFINGVGPVSVHKAVISTLAGQVFPRPVWALRWRLWVFYLCMFMQKYVQMVPRRPKFVLMDEPPVTFATASPAGDQADLSDKVPTSDSADRDVHAADSSEQIADRSDQIKSGGFREGTRLASAVAGVSGCSPASAEEASRVVV